MVEELGVDALLPGPALVHEIDVEAPEGADLEDVGRRHPGLGEALGAQELSEQTGVGTVRLRPLLAAPLGGGVRRLGEMGVHASGDQLLDDEPPPGAALDGERHVGAVAEALSEPAP